MELLGVGYQSNSYKRQVSVARKLYETMGREIINQAYFTNNPELIRSAFDAAFASEEELMILAQGQSINNGKYLEFVEALDAYCNNSIFSLNYWNAQKKVYSMIEQYKLNTN